MEAENLPWFDVSSVLSVGTRGARSASKINAKNIKKLP